MSGPARRVDGSLILTTPPMGSVSADMSMADRRIPRSFRSTDESIECCIINETDYSRFITIEYKRCKKFLMPMGVSGEGGLMERDSRSPLVMVIDDEPENLNVLDEVLRRGGHRVGAFLRGDLAIEEAVRSPPDLVLLDVSMPGMDGYAVCEAMKGVPRLAQVPIIFISGLDATEDKIRAFDVGGSDYLTKPFCAKEVLKRIEVQLRVRQLQRELERHNRRLEEMVRERSAELAEAHRQLVIWNQAKSGWLHMVSHEMRTPMTGLLGVADLMAAEITPGSPLADLASAYQEARDRMMGLIDDAALLTGIQAGSTSLAWTPVELQGMLKLSVATLAPRAGTTAILLGDACGRAVDVLGDRRLICKAIDGMMWTAICCTPEGSSVTVAAAMAGPGVDVYFELGGEPMPPDVAASLFEVCGQRKLFRAGGDLGLAPVMSRQVARLMGGDADVIQPSGQGTILRLRFRRAGGDSSGRPPS